MSGDSDWLLTISVRGREFRYAGQTREVAATTGGATRVFRSGLLTDGLALSANTESDVGLDVADPLLWDFAGSLDTGEAVLRRWREGETLDQARVWMSGELVGTSYGERDEPIGLTISRYTVGATLGTQVPDPMARVDVATWPVTALHTAGSSLPYPVILGVPGFTGTDPPECVVPVPIAQLYAATTATTYFVVAEDPDAECEEVEVELRDADATFTQSVSVVSDLLGKRIRVADCVDGGLTSVPASERALVLVGYSPNGNYAGGGAARDLYSVIRYLCRRWGGSSLDVARLADAREALERYLVDTWIDIPITDPWVLIDEIVADLPLRIRVGERGRYLVERRYSRHPRYEVGAITEGETASRRSRVRLDGHPVNEVSALFQSHSRDGWLRHIIATGDKRDVQPAGVTAPSTTYVELAPARVSRATYGRRPSDDGPRQISWTWDEGTVISILQSELERTAMPARMIAYDVAEGIGAEDWSEGDEVLVTDDGIGLAAVSGIIDAPPVVSARTVSLQLRFPNEGIAR